MTNQIEFLKSGEWVMRITADRRIEVNEDVTVTEAAQTVIEAVQKLLEQQTEPVHGDIRVLKYRIHELEGEVLGYKRMLDVAEAPPQRKPLTDTLEALFTNIDHAISSGAWNVQTGSQTWEIIQEAKAAHGIKE